MLCYNDRTRTQDSIRMTPRLKDWRIGTTVTPSRRLLKPRWDLIDLTELSLDNTVQGGKPSKLKNVFKRMSRTEETRSLLNESLNNNLEKHREEEEDKLSAGCFGNTLLYIFLKIFDWTKKQVQSPTYIDDVITQIFKNSFSH